MYINSYSIQSTYPDDAACQLLKLELRRSSGSSGYLNNSRVSFSANPRMFSALGFCAAFGFCAGIFGPNLFQ